jgi:hypothetical protein
MRFYKKILLTPLIVFIAIQFRQAGHNTNSQILPTGITKTINVPEKLLHILKNYCYDCHSNTTRYPSYVVQPIGWTMASHVKNGKKNLNFSDFGTYSNRKQANKLRAIETSIKDGSMPLSSYIIMHTDTKLSTEDKNLIADWGLKYKG